jgi:capsular exopolysaccharide synthesis family protein
MFRANKTAAENGTASVLQLTETAAPDRRLARTSNADPWKDLGHPGFADIVRRICTVCGWTAATPGTGQMLAISSAIEREGKSSVARALAISMARDHDGDVLLIECDTLRPSLNRDFGIELSPGLTEVLTGEAQFSDGLHQTRMSNLWLLPVGAQHENPSRLLRSPAMSAMLNEARMRFAFIVVDVPAILRTTDAAVLARMSDGVVMVVRAGSTDQRAVDEALQLLAGAHVHGVVLNRWRTRVPGLVRRLVEL